MTVLINKGWLYISNSTDEMELAFVEFSADFNNDTEFSHFASGLSYSYDVKKEYWVFKFKNLIFDSVTDYETFMSNIRSWNATAPFTMSIYKNGSSTKAKIDGDNTDYTVRIAKKGIKGCTLKPGGVDVAVAGMLVLEEG